MSSTLSDIPWIIFTSQSPPLPPARDEMHTSKKAWQKVVIPIFGARLYFQTELTRNQDQ
jgi:hypothetical protein